MKIDKEFESLLSPLDPAEYELLVADLKEHGCRDPIAVWKGTILDGHNRFKICQEHGIAFDTIEVDLPDRESAKMWIVRNQLSRRNILDQHRLMYLGMLGLERLAPGPGRPKMGHDYPFAKASDLAKEHGVSRETVKRAKRFAKAVEALGPEVKAKVMSSEPPSVSEVVEASELPEEERKEAAKALAAGSRPQPSKVIVVRDLAGNRIYDRKTQEIFGSGMELVDKVLAYMLAVSRAMTKLTESPASALMDLQGIKIDLENARRKVKFGAPWAAVPKGWPDDKFSKAGFMTRTVWDSLPEERRQSKP